jgi:hypothetical protein
MRFVIVGLVALLVGCASILPNVNEVEESVAPVDDAIMSGEVVNTLNSVELNLADMAVLEDALIKYKDFRSTWIGNFGNALDNDDVFDQFQSDFADLVVKYNRLSDMVARNHEKYTESNMATILDYQDTAIKYYETTMQFIEVGDRQRSIMGALEYADVVARVLVRL